MRDGGQCASLIQTTKKTVDFMVQVTEKWENCVLLKPGAMGILFLLGS